MGNTNLGQIAADYYNGEEAAARLEISISALQRRFPPCRTVGETGTNGGGSRRFYYSKARIEMVREARTKVCAICGRSFVTSGRRVTCSQGCSRVYTAKKTPQKTRKKYMKTKEDPYGVMVRPRLGVRVCKHCGKRIEIGRYRCPCEKWATPGEFRDFGEEISFTI